MCFAETLQGHSRAAQHSGPWGEPVLMPDSSRMRPRHRARIRQALLRETGPYHYTTDKIHQQWIPFPQGYTPAYRRPEGQLPEPRWEIRLTYLQPSLDYKAPDEAFLAHQHLPQPLQPQDPSEWVDLPEPEDSIFSESEVSCDDLSDDTLSESEQ